MKRYKPINCDLYDQYEIYAMSKQWLHIQLVNGQSMVNQLKTLETIEKIEYGLFMRGQRIRLDEISDLVLLTPEGSLLGHIVDKLCYNLWANQSIMKLIKSDEKPNNRDVALMSHIINALEIWNKRILKKTCYSGVWQVHTIDTWEDLLQRAQEDSFCALDEYRLDHQFNYHDTKGEPLSAYVGATLTHLINHSTYHRGQIIINRQDEQRPTLSTDYFRYRQLMK